MANQLGTISKTSLLLILFLIIISLQPAYISAQPPTKPTYFIEVCRSAYGNYTPNTPYERNLNHTLHRLTKSSSSSSSINTFVGNGENRMYGQYYCRGDINSHLCPDCIYAAAHSILKNCSQFKAAIMWYEECTLLYGNNSSVGLETEYPRSYWSSLANVSDTDRFGAVLNSTVDRIINESAYGDASRHFATGEVVVLRNETAYCLVQCRPGLNGTECETCLRSAYEYVREVGGLGVCVLPELSAEVQHGGHILRAVTAYATTGTFTSTGPSSLASPIITGGATTVQRYVR